MQLLVERMTFKVFATLAVFLPALKASWTLEKTFEEVSIAECDFYDWINDLEFGEVFPQYTTQLTCQIACLFARDTCNGYMFKNTHRLCKLSQRHLTPGELVIASPNVYAYSAFVPQDIKPVPRVAALMDAQVIHDLYDLENDPVHKYNFLMGTFPYGRASLVTRSRRTILVCGGLDPGDMMAIGDCGYHDIGDLTGSFNSAGHGGMAQARVLHDAAELHGRMWVTGGSSTSIESYDGTDTTEFCSKLSCTPGPNLPVALTGHCLAEIDSDRVLLAGGITKKIDGAIDRAWIYNANLDSWKELGNMKAKRHSFFCGVLKDATDGNKTKLLVAGGLATESESTSAMDSYETYTLDDPADEWTLATDQMVDKQYRGASIVLGEASKFFTIGGLVRTTTTTSEPASQPYRFTFEDKWTKSTKMFPVPLQHNGAVVFNLP